MARTIRDVAITWVAENLDDPVAIADLLVKPRTEQVAALRAYASSLAADRRARAAALEAQTAQAAADLEAEAAELEAI